MSRTNLAHSSDSKAFDDLLGQLVDELAMSPASSQVDPAPQVKPAPHPDEATYAAQPGATPYVVPPSAPARPNRTPIAVAAIIAGSIVALGVAAMLILPSGASQGDGAQPNGAESTPTAEPATEVAAPAPPPPTPVPVVIPTPPPPEEASDEADAKADAPEAAATPTKKPKKKAKKKPAPKPRPKSSGDSFDDL